jgi:hypothetical protein
LTVGDQKAERDGFEALARSYGVSGKLFHKLSLDSSEAGYALAHDVGAAIDDVSSSRVVACVLTTIDDALDRSDPGGIEWTADTVKHLRPLLERARRAGRVVVLTSDHGHIVERRAGRTAPARDYSSNRSRPYAVGSPPVEGEVRVRGRRVLLHDGDAVLAVDERLRYGPLKAGYHGGAAPAEVVIPVAVLALGEAPEGWRHAPPQSPAWWRGPLSEPTVQLVTPPSALPSTVAVRNARPDEVPTLFDDVEAAARPAGLVAEVLASATYREQRSRATRAAVTDAQVGALLTALLSVSGNRLDPESAAAALGVATVQLEGALSQARRLLNVEQYPVLDRDADGSTIVLDVDLLREQFGVSV